MIVYCKSLFYYGIGKLLFWVGTTIGGKINLSALKASINCFDKSLELKKKTKQSICRIDEKRF